jgi:quercetin dioxygenase-like cupin family protein
MNRERKNKSSMSQDTEFKSKGLPGARVTKAVELVNYQDGAIVSREIVKKPTCTVTVFAFDIGQSLSEHTASSNALIQVLEGEAVITISGSHHRLQSGGLILVPAREPHALVAVKRFKMLLTMIRS